MRNHIDAMKKAGKSLAFFAFISVVFVSVTHMLTAKKIEQNQTQMLLQALNEVVDKDTYDNDLAASKITLKPEDLDLAKETQVYLATLDNKPVTAIFEVTTLQGYSGAITLLVGINAEKRDISGVRIIKHGETPGLGDKMELRKSNWVFSFNGKSLDNPQLSGWQVKKDGGEFDQFTGATITPRAIVNVVKTTLLYAQDHMDALFQYHLKSRNQNQ